MNNIFQKNISVLSLKNPILAQKLMKHVPDEIPKLIQENGAYNLVYKEKYIHNRENPVAEAQEIFSLSKNEPVSIHLIYGLGLGYLFQIASASSDGTVVLYEPDLNIMWAAFTLVDFSNDIARKNVYIVDSFEALSEEIYKKSGMKNSPELLSLPSQREFDADGFKILVNKLKELVGAFFLDLKFTKEKFYPSLKMLLYNVPKLAKEIPLDALKDSYKGKTAVIVSAGPTLDRNIETLKKNREKYVLFVVGTAVKTIYEHGLKPDFLCIIETYNSTKQIEGLDLSEVNLITEPYSHPALRHFKYKQVYTHISDNAPTNRLWREISLIDTKEYSSKGTVSYTALNSARLLGFSKIIFVGQDLAYVDGQCYSKDSVYKDLYCGFNSEKQRWEIMAKNFEEFADLLSPLPDKETRKIIAQSRLDNLNASLHMVKGIKGDMIPTESVYSAFVRPLSEFTQVYSDRIYINTSMIGAQIDGFDNVPLEEALSSVEPAEEIVLRPQNAYDIDNIKKALLQKKEELNSATVLLEVGQKYVKNIKNELKRTSDVSVDILKILKKLAVNYLELSSDFSNKSCIFDLITSAEKIDLDYEMKMTKTFTVDSVGRINNFLSTYYTNAQAKIAEVNKLLDRAVVGLE